MAEKPIILQLVDNHAREMVILAQVEGKLSWLGVGKVVWGGGGYGGGDSGPR